MEAGMFNKQLLTALALVVFPILLLAAENPELVFIVCALNRARR